MSSIEQHIRALAPAGIRINIWPVADGFQANVSEAAGGGWTCETEADPIDALATALRLRATGVATRTVLANPEPLQLDIEDAIARAPSIVHTVRDDCNGKPCFEVVAAGDDFDELMA